MQPNKINVDWPLRAVVYYPQGPVQMGHIEMGHMFVYNNIHNMVRIMLKHFPCVFFSYPHNNLIK